MFTVVGGVYSLSLWIAEPPGITVRSVRRRRALKRTLEREEPCNESEAAGPG